MLQSSLQAAEYRWKKKGLQKVAITEAADTIAAIRRGTRGTCPANHPAPEQWRISSANSMTLNKNSTNNPNINPMSTLSHTRNRNGTQKRGRTLPVLRVRNRSFNSIANNTTDQTIGPGKSGMEYCAVAPSKTAGQKFKREPRASANINTAIVTLNAIKKIT